MEETFKGSRGEGRSGSLGVGCALRAGGVRPVQKDRPYDGPAAAFALRASAPKKAGHYSMRADDVARDDHLDTAILLSSRGGVVGCDGMAFAQSQCSDGR
jgi:hypothetical protein